MAIKFRRLLFVLVFLIFPFCAFALEYSEAYEKVASAFEKMLTGEEGQTAFKSFFIPMGGRSEAMAEAFTAVADDVSCMEYNPAGLALLTRSEFAFLHNAWIADSAVDTIAFARQAGDFGFGASARFFYLPFTEYNAIGQRVSGGYYSESLLTLSGAYTFFNGYNFRGLTVGGSVKIGWRNVPDFSDKNDDTIQKDSGISQSGLAFMGDLGILLRFNAAKNFDMREPNLVLGFSFLNLGAGITGFKKSIKLDDPLPTKFSFGISYRPIKPLVLSLDVQQPINLFGITKYEFFYASFGIAGHITNFLSLFAGFGVHAANPRVSLGVEARVKSIRLNANYTLDMNSSLNPFNHFSLGIAVLLGKGGRSMKQIRIDALYNEGIRFFSEGDLDNAQACWEEALKINPRFDPAREGLEEIADIRKRRKDMGKTVEKLGGKVSSDEPETDEN